MGWEGPRALLGSHRVRGTGGAGLGERGAPCPLPSLLTGSLHLRVGFLLCLSVCLSVALSRQEPAPLRPSLPRPSRPSLPPWASTATAPCPPSPPGSLPPTLCTPTGFTPTQVGVSAAHPAPATGHEPRSLSRLGVGYKASLSCSVTRGRDVPSGLSQGS